MESKQAAHKRPVPYVNRLKSQKIQKSNDPRVISTARRGAVVIYELERKCNYVSMNHIQIPNYDTQSKKIFKTSTWHPISIHPRLPSFLIKECSS